MKKTWAGSQQHIAVYESSGSGEPKIIVVTRYKTGLKERQAGAMKPLPERYEAANGAGTFAKYAELTEASVDHSFQELLFTRTDLGSK